MDGSTDGGDREGRPMSLSEVSNILWRERRLLDLLVFKLEEERFVLESGRMRWLTHATREVEKVLEEINRIELERAMAVAGAARDRRAAVGRHLRGAPERPVAARTRDRRQRGIEPRNAPARASRRARGTGHSGRNRHQH